MGPATTLQHKVPIQMPPPNESFSDLMQKLMAHSRLHLSTEGLIGQWHGNTHFKVCAGLTGRTCTCTTCGQPEMNVECNCCVLRL